MAWSIVALKVAPRILVPIAISTNILSLALPFIKDGLEELSLLGVLAVGHAAALPLCVGLNFLEEVHNNLNDVADRICSLEFLRVLVVTPMAPCIFYYGVDSKVLLQYWFPYYTLMAVVSTVIALLALTSLPTIYQTPQLHKCHVPIAEILSRKTFLCLAMGEFFAACTWKPVSHSVVFWMLIGATEASITWEVVMMVVARLLISGRVLVPCLLSDILVSMAKSSPIGKYVQA